MAKTMHNYTQQMLMMKMVHSAIDNSDYDKINDLFNYLLVVKEEEQLRSAIKKRIDAFKVNYDPSVVPVSVKEANDPMRVLFDYMKTPQDTIDQLVNKYIILSPETKTYLDNLRVRKNDLYEKVKTMTKERDAFFLAQNTGKLAGFVNTNSKDDSNFDIQSEQVQESIKGIMDTYHQAMNATEDPTKHMVALEKEYDLTPEEIQVARQKMANDQSSKYAQIVKSVKGKVGTSFEDVSSNILADVDSITKSSDSTNQFFEAFKSDSMEGVKRADIESLLRPDLVKALRQHHNDIKTIDHSQGLDSESTVSEILDKKITDYYSFSDNEKPGHSKFINHLNGEVVHVDSKKLATDPKYFTQVVANLAKIEISNMQWHQQVKNKEKQEIISGLMKSREFRKFYYFTRKFYYNKLEERIEEGTIKVDEFGNFTYSDPKKPVLASDELKNEFFHMEDEFEDRGENKTVEYDNKSKHVNSVFQPPTFDIIDFKEYFPQDEYSALMKEYYEYTRGDTDKSKAEFIKTKLLGDTLESKVKHKISKNLGKLYKKLGLDADQSVAPSKLFGPIVPRELVDISETDIREKESRRKHFDDLYKEELVYSWNYYKKDKINDYLMKNPELTIDISRPLDFQNMTANDFGKAMEEVSEISNLIDLTDVHQPKEFKPSSDHVAFEFFDKVVDLSNFTYSDKQDKIDKEIFGDDGFEKGYKNQSHMVKKFGDIYEGDDPDELKGLGINSQSIFEKADRSSNLAKRKQKVSQKEDKPKMEYFNPQVDTNLDNDEFPKNYNQVLKSLELPFNQKEELKEDDFFKVNETPEFANAAMTLGDKLEQVSELMLPGRSNDENDLYNEKEDLYSQTLSGLRHELQDSIVAKKQNAVGIALRIFKKIQGIELSHNHTLDTKGVDISEVDPENQNLPEHLRTTDDMSSDEIVQTLKLLKNSLDDSTSPSLSHIKDLHKKGLLGQSNELAKQVVNTESDDFFEVTKNLEGIYEELERKENAMIDLQNTYDTKLNLLKYDQSTSKIDLQNKEAARVLEEKVLQAYKEYQRDLLAKAQAEASQGVKELTKKNKALQSEIWNKHDAKNISLLNQGSDFAKIQTIRNMFGITEAREICNFGTDLVEFGMAHDIPDAVRLGENIAGINNEQVSDDLTERLKQYSIKNSQRLREGIQFTGPMKGIIQGRKEKNFRQSGGEFYIPNETHQWINDRYNKWRVPSIYAIEHTKYGVWSQIFNGKNGAKDGYSTGEERLNGINISGEFQY